MKKLVSVLLVAAMMMSMLIGCADEDVASDEGGGSKELTIAFSFEDLETEFWVASHEIITESLAEKGYKVIELNCQGDANKQLEQVNDALTQDIDGIIMIPVDGDTAGASSIGSSTVYDFLTGRLGMPALFTAIA